MKIKSLAKMFAKFRIKFRTVKEEKIREKNLTTYYANMLEHEQVFPLFNETGILVALCEVWKLKKEEIEEFKKTKIPKSIFDGDIIFAIITIDPHFVNIGVARFYKQLLRNHIYKGYGIFWYTKRNRFTKIFRR